MLFKTARRLVVAVIGSTVVLIGIAMIVLPGPAVVVIPAGLAILGTEFVWARSLLNRFKNNVTNFAGAVRRGFETQPIKESTVLDSPGELKK